MKIAQFRHRNYASITIAGSFMEANPDYDRISRYEEVAFSLRKSGKCNHCGKIYELTPRMEGKGKKYCSDSCRVMACRKRRKES